MRRKYAILVAFMYSLDIQTVIISGAHLSFPIPYFILRYMPFRMAKDAFSSLETCPIAVQNMPDRTSIHGFSQRRSSFSSLPWLENGYFVLYFTRKSSTTF